VEDTDKELTHPAAYKYNEETDANVPLKDVREHWRRVIEADGGYCPCCDRWGKIYRRPLNASMARALVWLVNAQHRGDGWVHVPSSAPMWLLRTQQLPALWMWNLVVGYREKKSKLTTSGLWQPTRLGMLFASDQASVKRYVYVYNNEVLETDGEEISIRDALGDKYNYDEIMANYDGSAKSWDDWTEDGDGDYS
jgi:hypothetical protein